MTIEHANPVIGIQGGRGSFNEEAVRWYLNKNDIRLYKLRYLYTSWGVLQTLRHGEIYYGQFALYNTIGGVVEESLQAMANFTFNILDRYSWPIVHSLIVGKDVEIDEIDTIIAHPQAIKQCGDVLLEKYPNIKVTAGEGDLIDTAKVAESLATNELSKNIATIGNKAVAEICDLKVIDDDLQGGNDIFTEFLFVERQP